MDFVHRLAQELRKILQLLVQQLQHPAAQVQLLQPQQQLQQQEVPQRLQHSLNFHPYLLKAQQRHLLHQHQLQLPPQQLPTQQDRSLTAESTFYNS